MSHREFYEWLDFRLTYGPMNPYYRNDYSTAMLMQQQGGGKIERYIPFIQLPKKKTNEKNLLNDFDKLEPVIKKPKNVSEKDRKFKIAKRGDSVLKLEERKKRLEKIMVKKE